MNDEVFAKLEKMFRTCHAMAKHNRPFKDFVWQCQLDKAKGLKIGTTYNKSALSYHLGLVGRDGWAMFKEPLQIFSGAMRHYCYTCNSF